MKTILPILILALSAGASQAAAPAVGAIAPNSTFAVRSGASFANKSLDDYEGKILVVMMMTPWCPFCQSNAQAVGDGVLDVFNASSRESLIGKNDKGTPIESILLSTEPAASWDSVNASFSTTNGYQQWGLDANAGRTNPRSMLGYFRGGFPNGINSSNLYDWGNDRRRVIVINLVRNSASHAYRQIILNQNAFTSADNVTARNAINAISPAPAGRTFVQWRTALTFPTGESGANDDPDGDGISNLLESFHGSHPLESTLENGRPRFTRDVTGLRLIYQRAKNLSGYTIDYQSSIDLIRWTSIPESSLEITTQDLGTVDEVTVKLPATSETSSYYQIKVNAS